MQIDRARFLLLTASLAGGGCSSNPPADPVPAPAPTETGAEVAVSETSDLGQTAETTESADPEPTTTPSQPQPPTGACDNDAGTVPTCSIAAPPGPFCESFTDTKAACKSYKTGLRAGVAAKAVACLNAVSGTQAVCDWQKSEQCATEAVRTACVQPSTFNQCSPVVSTCAGNQWSKLTMQDCQALLSSVKDGKRKAMITCMTEGCSIDSCMYSLR